MYYIYYISMPKYSKRDEKATDTAVIKSAERTKERTTHEIKELIEEKKASKERIKKLKEENAKLKKENEELDDIMAELGIEQKPSVKKTTKKSSKKKGDGIKNIMDYLNQF